MSFDLNYTAQQGRLTRDVEIKYTSTGKAVTKFSIANGGIGKDESERKNNTSFFDVTVWGDQAVNCQKYLKKGSSIIVEGKLKQNRWQDKETGKTVSKIEINAFLIHFLDSAKKIEGDNPQANGNKITNPWQDTPPPLYDNDNAPYDTEKSPFDDYIPF